MSASDVRQLLAKSSDQVDDLVVNVVSSMRARDVPGWDPTDGLANEDVYPVMRDVFEEFLRTIASPDVRMTPAGRDTLDVSIRLRMQRGASLSEVLQSYRVGGSGIWHHLAAQVERGVADHETLTTLTPRVFELVDQYSGHLNQAYGDLLSSTSAQERRARAAQPVDLLLGLTGPATTSEIEDAADSVRIPRRGWFLVLCRRTGGALPRLPTTSSILGCWASSDDDHELWLVSMRGSARTDDIVAAALKERQTPLGVSAVFTAVVRAPAMARQAREALASTSRNHTVVRYDHDVLDILLSSSPQATRSLIEETLGRLTGSRDRRLPALATTVRTYLRHNRSVDSTAAEMHCHRNTVNYRLRRFEEITGGSFADSTWVAQLAVILLSPWAFDVITDGGIRD